MFGDKSVLGGVASEVHGLIFIVKISRLLIGLEVVNFEVQIGEGVLVTRFEDGVEELVDVKGGVDGANEGLSELFYGLEGKLFLVEG